MQQRLFEIIWHLSREGGATAGELADRFGVSRRTIYRDIDALSGAGIPIYAEKGKGGGIRLLPDFVLDRTLLSKEEQSQLMEHLQSLATLGTPDTEPMLDKLAALFGKRDGWLEVDFAPWAGGEDTRRLFRLLRDAIQRRQVVELAYTGAEVTTQRRQVEPVKVFFRGQGWYLQAFCRLRGNFRFFKLNRIANATLTGEAFDPRPAPDSEPGYQGRVAEVVLRLSPAHAHRAVDEFGPGQLERTPDGGYLVQCPFPTDGGWLVGYLLSFGPGAEVLEPAELRAQMAEAAAQIAAAYQNPPVES